MKAWIVTASAVLALGVITAGSAIAGPVKPGKGVACPVCKMTLSSKKTTDNTVAVRMKKGGPVMYCCAKCKMPGSVLVKSGKTAPKMGHMKMGHMKMAK